MRRNWLVAASLAAATICAASAVAADDGPPTGKAPPEAPKAGSLEPKKDEPSLRVERAKQIVRELEEAVARARAAQPVDAQMLQPLLLALEQAKSLAKPAKPDELTAEEKKAVVDEAKKLAGEDPAAKPPGSDWAEKQLAKAFDGADLNEEEQIKATKVIGDWFKEFQASTGDSKKQSDLKRKRDDDLEKAIGHRKANKVINNLNAMGPGRGR